MGDALWIGVDGLEDGELPSLNVFRKNGELFECVKIIDGPEAVKLYLKLTRKEETGDEC